MEFYVATVIWGHIPGFRNPAGVTDGAARKKTIVSKTAFCLPSISYCYVAQRNRRNEWTGGLLTTEYEESNCDLTS